MWIFPLKTYAHEIPKNNHPGAFGAIRKFDIHTGVDLYAEEGQDVMAVEDGEVVAVNAFTGPAAGLPWWNDTQAIIIKGKTGFVVYGEVNPLVKLGDKVFAGQVVGKVLQVLKKNKGKPTSMLHLELYSKLVEPVIWNLNQIKPDELLDPTDFLEKSLV